MSEDSGRQFGVFLQYFLQYLDPVNVTGTSIFVLLEVMEQARALLRQFHELPSGDALEFNDFNSLVIYAKLFARRPAAPMPDDPQRVAQAEEHWETARDSFLTKMATVLEVLGDDPVISELQKCLNIAIVIALDPNDRSAAEFANTHFNMFIRLFTDRMNYLTERGSSMTMGWKIIQ